MFKKVEFRMVWVAEKEYQDDQRKGRHKNCHLESQPIRPFFPVSCVTHGLRVDAERESEKGMTREFFTAPLTCSLQDFRSKKF